MNGLIERCARAACEALGDDPDREGDERVTGYDEATRAVLRTATAGITDDMIRAVAKASGVWPLRSVELSELHAILTELREAGR